MAFSLCLLSAGLLAVSFPQIEIFPVAWVAVVPLLCALDGQKSWRAFRRAWACGFLFFLVTLGWIVYVTPIGALLLAAFLALYFALFGLLFVYFQRLPVVPRIFVLASGWVALEFIRAHFLSGFGWVMLGHTQYKNIWLIQIADTTGVYGISFLVMLVNLLVFENWRRRTFLLKANLLVAAIVALVLVYGITVSAGKKDIKTVRVGIVQPNISLAQDWDDNLRPWIIAKTLRLTQRLREQKLDLIVWPETSLPGLIDDDTFLVKGIQATASEMHTPILMGSMAREGKDYFNSAFLVGADGQMQGRYDKIHLVPFGEYLPVRPLLGWINKFVPLDDFTPGRKYKIFSLSPGPKKFAVLICFEDTLGDLSRQFAKAGAEFFVNITNDAWFRDTKEPFLHLQTAVFGCVENHRALVRAANTGVSALVDPWGRILGMAHDEHGKKTFVAATAWGEVPLNDQETFYTKFGDIFTYLCFLCILIAGVLRK